ncbi:MAG: protein tyrosine phosphatase (PTP) superfamily phosphohydrolase (DUF442 family) [Halieaceae bacterium]|jgi:protein tyrosine phosphatase (PTP) superfamily phosphohydrolase (DUF442 family)
MSVDKAYNFKRIDDRVATAGVVNEEQLASLRCLGYEVVINLLPESSKYAIGSERELVTAQALDYRYIPVDFSAPAEADYQAFVRAMHETKDQQVLVHCAANFRVSAFYGVYAFERLGWSATQTRAHISSIWNPAEHPPWDEFIKTHLNNQVRDSETQT